jgi:cysteine desulfurase
VAGIVAMTVALELADAERPQQNQRIAALRDRFVDTLCSRVDDVVETVPRQAKVAGSAHACIGGIENEALLFLLDEQGVCASAASACASGAMEPSHVLAAMGVPTSTAMGAVRFTFGRASTDTDVDTALDVVVDAVTQLRRRAGVGG